MTETELRNFIVKSLRHVLKEELIKDRKTREDDLFRPVVDKKGLQKLFPFFSTSKLSKLVRENQIPFYKKEGLIVFDPVEINSWLKTYPVVTHDELTSIVVSEQLKMKVRKRRKPWEKSWPY